MKISKKQLMNEILDDGLSIEHRRGVLSFERQWHEQHSSSSDFDAGFIKGLEHAEKILDGVFENVKHNKAYDPRIQ